MIGAGAIVSRDIPSNSVAVGIPARVIKTLEEYRASELAQGDDTKQMPPDQKRRYFVEKFGKAF